MSRILAPRGMAGMDGYFGRQWKAAQWEAFKLINRDDAAYVEQLITQLVARVRWANQVRVIAQRWLDSMPNDTRAQKLARDLNDYYGTLSTFSGMVRNAAAAARDDGHDIQISGNSIGPSDGIPVDPQMQGTGLGIIPIVIAGIVVVVVVAELSAATVAAYLGATEIQAAKSERTLKNGMDALIAAGRADQIPALIGAGTGPGGSEIGKGFGMIVGVGVLALGAYLFMGRRRRGRA